MFLLKNQTSLVSTDLNPENYILDKFKISKNIWFKMLTPGVQGPMISNHLNIAIYRLALEENEPIQTIESINTFIKQTRHQVIIHTFYLLIYVFNVITYLLNSMI